MRFSSLASWCLSIPGLRNWVPSSSISDQPTDPSYLNDHGYYVQYQHRTGQSAVYSDHPNPSAGFLAFFMHIDEARMVTTFYNNVLHQEISDDRSLELPQIYQAVCYQREVNFQDMKWVVMDVDDVSTLQIVQDYRKSHKLKRKDAFKVTPDDDEWALFSETRYYKDAARMNPDSPIDRILVQRQDRQTRNGEFPVVIAEVLMFSFKKPQEVFLDAIDAHAAELASEDEVNAAVKDANEAAEANLMDLLELNHDFFSETAFDTTSEGGDMEAASEPPSEPVSKSS